MNPSTAQPSQNPTPLLSLMGFRKFTPQQYHKLADAGILQEGEPIELLEGYLVEKAVRNPPHETSLRRLTNRLPGRVPSGWCCQFQGAVWFAESEPEPDGVVLRGPLESYDGRVPGAREIALVIEVADSSLTFDRRDKSRIYAREGIPVYWIINAADRQLEIYTDPDPMASPPAYRSRTDYRPGQDVPLVLDGAIVGAIPVADLLP